MGTASARPPPSFPSSKSQLRHTFTITTHTNSLFCTLRPSNNGGRHASDTDHADDGGDDDGAAAQLPGVRRGSSGSGPTARCLVGVRLRRRLLRGAGRGAGTHRALLCLRPGVRRAGRGARRVLRLHQAGALAEERAPAAPAGGASLGDKAAGCAAATAAAGAVKRDRAPSGSKFFDPLLPLIAG